MKINPRKLITLILVFSTLIQSAWAVQPAAVGWGNVFVPGLGATLRGESMRGLTEATAEIGTYYGGTYLAREGSFNIDGSLVLPKKDSLVRPLAGQVFQQFGLKLHMYDTFYNYQKASSEPENAELQTRYQQPLYKGSWDEVLLAPFKWKNLNTYWVYVPIVVTTLGLMLEYNTKKITPTSYSAKPAEEFLYGFSQGVSIPLGSSFGEEAFFRGFMQRELWLYTGSEYAAVGIQAVVFGLLHTDEIKPIATVGGVYFGLIANHFNGDLEPGIASHFWTDVINGVLIYFLFRKDEGKSVPFSIQTKIPF